MDRSLRWAAKNRAWERTRSSACGVVDQVHEDLVGHVAVQAAPGRKQGGLHHFGVVSCRAEVRRATVGHVFIAAGVAQADKRAWARKSMSACRDCGAMLGQDVEGPVAAVTPDGEHGGLVDLRIVGLLEQGRRWLPARDPIPSSTGTSRYRTAVPDPPLVCSNSMSMILAARVFHPAQSTNKALRRSSTDTLGLALDDLLEDGQRLVGIHAHQGVQGPGMRVSSRWRISSSESTLDLVNGFDHRRARPSRRTGAPAGLRLPGRSPRGENSSCCRRSKFDGALGSSLGPLQLVAREGLPVQVRCPRPRFRCS